jgi:hypothetical protein
LLTIPETWGVTSKTWRFVGETYFEVSTSTISISTFTSFGWRSISDIFLMWVP